MVVDAVGTVTFVEIGGVRLRGGRDVASLSQSLSCLLKGLGYISFCG